MDIDIDSFPFIDVSFNVGQMSYWDHFVGVSNFLTKNQIKSLNKLQGLTIVPYLPDEEVTDNQITNFGKVGLVRLSNECRIPAKWDKFSREILVGTNKIWLLKVWLDQKDLIRCLSVLVPKNWKKSMILPDRGIFSVYINKFGYRIPLTTLTNSEFSPADAVAAIERHNLCTINKPTVVLNTFCNYYVLIAPESVGVKGKHLFLDDAQWTCQAGNSKKFLVTEGKRSFSKEDFDNGGWNLWDSYEKDQVHLKYEKAQHIRLPVQRVVAYCVSASDESKLLSAVLVQYIFPKGGYIKEEEFLFEFTKISRTTKRFLEATAIFDIASFGTIDVAAKTSKYVSVTCDAATQTEDCQLTVTKNMQFVDSSLTPEKRQCLTRNGWPDVISKSRGSNMKREPPLSSSNNMDHVNNLNEIAAGMSERSNGLDDR